MIEPMATVERAVTGNDPRAAADRVARLLTEVLSPAVLVAVVLFAVAWVSAESPMSALVTG